MLVQCARLCSPLSASFRSPFPDLPFRRLGPHHWLRVFRTGHQPCEIVRRWQSTTSSKGTAIVLNQSGVTVIDRHQRLFAFLTSHKQPKGGAIVAPGSTDAPPQWGSMSHIHILMGICRNHLKVMSRQPRGKGERQTYVQVAMSIADLARDAYLARTQAGHVPRPVDIKSLKLMFAAVLEVCLQEDRRDMVLIYLQQLRLLDAESTIVVSRNWFLNGVVADAGMQMAASAGESELLDALVNEIMQCKRAVPVGILYAVWISRLLEATKAPARVEDAPSRGPWDALLVLIDRVKAAGGVASDFAHIRAIEYVGLHRKDLPRARVYFEDAQTRCTPSSILYLCGMMMRVLSAHNDHQAVLRLLVDMKERGLRPDVVVYSIAVSAATRGSLWASIPEIIAQMHADGHPLNHIILTQLLLAHGKLGHVSHVREVFQTVKYYFAATRGTYPDKQAYEAVIKVLGEMLLWEEAVDLYDEMVHKHGKSI